MQAIERVKLNVDWLKIVNMALQRKDWGRTFTLHIYGDVSITAKMNSFNFEHNSANFHIECVYPMDNLYSRWGSYDCIDYRLENYTPEFFNIQLLKKIRSLIIDIIADRTRTKAVELFNETMFDIVTKEMIEVHGYTEAFNQIQEISIELIRNKAIDALEKEILLIANIPYRKSVADYIKTHKECPSSMLGLLEEITRLIEEGKE